MKLLTIQDSQITRLTWKGFTQPNYGGNTFAARATVCASHILSGIAKLQDYKCYTFNGSYDITTEFHSKVLATIDIINSEFN